VLPSLQVVSIFRAAVPADKGLNIEQAIFPSFGGLGVIFLAIWTFTHMDSLLSFFGWLCLKVFLPKLNMLLDFCRS
jgi:hypothetical protein